MNNVNSNIRETVFERIVNRESEYFQHSGILWWSDWAEVPKGTETDFINGDVISEADINYSLKMYYICDVYTVLDSVALVGAVVIAGIFVCEVTPVVIANIQLLTYYMQTYGIVNGITCWNIFGASALPDGILSVIQLDLADGDSQVDDIVEMVIVGDLQDGDSQLDDCLIIAKNLSADLINKKVVLYFVQADAADGDLCYDDAVFSTYTYMRVQMEGSGLETHHLIEKRLILALQRAFPNANLTEGTIISTPLNPQAHLVYTKAWRDFLPYGDSGSYEIDDVILAVQTVYKNDPVMLNAANDWLRSLGAVIP